MNRWIVRAAFTAGALLLAGGAQAASFDCKKAQSPVEQTICKDLDLSAYDSQMEAAYAGALDRSEATDKLREQQRAWIKTRDACADAACMKAAYISQIALLAKVDDAPPICEGGSTPEVNACGKAYADRAERELARYVAAARKEVAETAAGSTGQEAKGALKSFDKAQAAWVAYRKAECDAVYDAWSDGTIRGAMFEGCMSDVTKARSLAIWETWLRPMDDSVPVLPQPVGDGVR